jgi:hypothetical protein
MKIQKLERTQLSFMEKMTLKDPKTLQSYNVAINNFENFCMEEYDDENQTQEIPAKTNLRLCFPFCSNI